MRQLRALLAASSLAFLLTHICLLTVAATPQDQTLQLGTPVERQLGAGESHTFRVTMEENQLIQLVVEQNGIDVVVRVDTPAGKPLGTFDSPNGDNGPENVSFVAAAPGAYRITVAPLNQEGTAPTGKYEIKIIELRQATEQEIKTYKNLEVVKAKGIALLDEVDRLIPELRTSQTRIRTQLQAAQLLWDTDEKRGMKYLTDAMNSVKEFLSTMDATSPEYGRSYGPIAQLRFEIIQVMAGHDPDAALNFLYSTKVPADPYNGNQAEQASQDRSMELSIANQILEKDPKRAVQIARQNLKKGYSPSLVNTVAALRNKNPEMATELASDIATKLIGEKLLKQPEAAALSVSLVSLCNAKQNRIQVPNRRIVPAEPVLPDQLCHDLLQKIAQEALSYSAPSNVYTPGRDAAWGLLNGLQTLGQDLETIVPGGAASVQKKLAELNSSNNPYQATVQNFQTKIDSGAMDNALESIQKAPDEIKEQLYVQVANMMAAKGDSARARQIINDNITNPFQRRQALANLEQQELYQAMTRGKVEEALRTIAAMRTPRERANMLIQVARQIGPGQKRATALSFLEQARSLLAPGGQAQDQEQMAALLELSRAFARYDSKRAFEIVDPLIDQFNDICSAARTLEGFGFELYQDDELDLQNGSSIANIAGQITGALGTLAITNFERAKSTSDRLRQPELRLRAYLDIAQQTIQGPR